MAQIRRMARLPHRDAMEVGLSSAEAAASAYQLVARVARAKPVGDVMALRPGNVPILS
jgi:hypothetical protein